MTRRRNMVVGLVLLTATGLAGCGGGSDQADGSSDDASSEESVVRVAAASDLQFALGELKPIVAEQHPGVMFEATYGSSGTFLQQITEGAPYDLYLSADLGFPEQLVDDGLADSTDLFSYAVGRLVVWTPEGSEVDPSAGLSVLTDPALGKVAIANPEHAPYGRAAVAAMETAGVYNAVQPKLVLGENIAQAADFVTSGGADAGVVAMSLVLADPLRDQGRWTEVPLESFPTLEQGGVVLSDASDAEAARAVRDSMLSEQGRELLKRYGFFLPTG